MGGHELLLNLAGGVALLLWATRMVRTGIMRAYGADLRRFLSRSTRSRVTACGMGIVTAGLLQSSTATALLTTSFAGRGLIAMAPGLAIMLGADVGSTLVVQLLSFGMAGLSPVFFLIGLIAFLSSSSSLWRQLGRVLIGLGLMLLSLTLIVGASAPLRGSETLQIILAPLSSDPILALLLGAVITWIAHSSVAVVLLVMSLTLTGVVPPALGFALVLGANIGSAIVPMALSFAGSPIERRIPFGNLLFRTLGAIAMLPFIGAVTPLMDVLGSDPARQIANFHTAFNLALALVFLPFTGVMAALAMRMFPATETADSLAAPKHLDPAAIERPSLALACATREVLRMADVVETMLRGVIDVFRSNDKAMLARISKLDDDVDALHEAIKLYLTKVSRKELSEEDSQRCVELIIFTTNLEHIGDIVDKNLLEIAQKKVKNRLAFSEQGWLEIAEMHARVMRQMQLCLTVFISGEVRAARQLLIEKERLRVLERQGSERHLERLRNGRIESLETSALHLDILRDLKRIDSHLTSVAYPILDAEGELRHSRLKIRSEDEPAAAGSDTTATNVGRLAGELSWN